MASLLPSEVARLVLGYVEDNNCQKTSEKLLEELGELSEFVQLRRKGRRVATRIGNQSLEDMLMDYSAAKDLVMESVRKNPSTLSDVSTSGNLLSQVKALISIILKNKLVVKKRKPSIGTAKRVKQYSRTVRLQNDLRKRNAKLREEALNATSLESLPGLHVDHLDGHSSSHLANSEGVQDGRQDSLGGDSTSASFTHDLDSTHQRRKGTVKRRSHGCELTPTKMSPGLDNEANFEKILKNLYENTALHEKIAESINRGLSTQCKADQSQDEASSHTNASPCSKKGKDSGSSNSPAEGKEKSYGSMEKSSSTSSGGDAALLKEFDHIVTGIVSEATSDPVFENLIDEVFGCISPQSGISKGDASTTSSQTNLQDHPNGPPRLLSTPVPPPPSSTPSSHSVLHINHTLPLNPSSLHPSSSVSPVVCHQSSTHCLSTLSTPHHHMSPINADSSHLSSPSGLHLVSFTSSPQSALSACKLFPKLSPKKIEDVWITKSLPHENSPAAKDGKSSETLRDAMQESLQNTSVNTIKEPAVDSWSSSTRMDTEDSSLTKHPVAVPSMSCGTESPQQEGCDRTRSNPSSPTVRNKSCGKKKRKRSSGVKHGKEEDQNLGEQLLKEFADFQSSRPDKICVEENDEGAKSTDKCEAPEKTNVQPLDLSIERKIKDEETEASDRTKRLSEEPVLAIDGEQETPSPLPQNTSENEVGVSSEATKESIPVEKELIDKGSVKTESTPSNPEPESVAVSSEGLSVTPYTRDTTEKETEHENKIDKAALNPAPALSVRSNTIPGFSNLSSSPDNNTYTLTELTPVNPIDLSSLVSTLCSTDEPDINYPDPTQITTSIDLQGTASTEDYAGDIWEPSTDATPLGNVQEGTSDHEGGKKLTEGLTIILPPVLTKKEADEQFMALFGGSQTPISEVVTVPAPVLPDPDLPSASSDKVSCKSNQKKRKELRLAAFGVSNELVTIAPKKASSTPLLKNVVGQDQQVDGKTITTYTLPNKVTVSIPELIPDPINTEIEMPKKRKRKPSTKKKTEPKKSVTKKAKETPNNAKATKKKKKKPSGKVVDMLGKKVKGRSKRRINNRNQKVEEDVSNNIIATALSFALNSVTPTKKKASLSNEASVGETFQETIMDLDFEVESAEEVKRAPGPSGAVTVNHPSSSGVGDSINESCEDLVQEQTAESVSSNANTQRTSKQTFTKFNSGRSPQLKELLHLSKSISPAKRASASEESPLIRVLHMRGTQSTPSRKNSHIRVLDFGTPQKRKACGVMPRKAVANLKFSPPAGKKSPRKRSKVSQLLSRKLSNSLATSKALTKIVEESEKNSEVVDSQAVSNKQGKTLSREPQARHKLDSSTLNPDKSDHKSNTKPGWVRQSSMSESEFSRDIKQPSFLMTEDEDSIVLYLDGEDSVSSCGKTPPTDSGSVELFDLPKEHGRYQDFNFNTAIKDLNPDSVSKQDLPSLIYPSPSPSITEHSEAEVKQMKTPYKEAPISSSLVTMTPVCLEPATPLLQTEQKSNCLPCDDLNTPIPQVIPNVNKTPLIKDYPQGPYSSSSVGTSYYMPSERSLTESEGYSPSRLDTLWEKTLTEEVDQNECNSDKDIDRILQHSGSVSDKSPSRKKSAVHDAKSNSIKHSPRKSPNKMSRKAMGQMIEREMVRLFSGQDSNSPVKEVNQVSLADVSNDSTSRDSTKGKQGRRRRVPSKKYQNMAESTCSEDENENTSSSRIKLKKPTRISSGSDSGSLNDLEKKDDITTETPGNKHISSSSDTSKTKKSTTINTRRSSPLSKERLKLEEADVSHSQNAHNQLSRKCNSSDVQKSSCHSPKRNVTSDKETPEKDSELKLESFTDIFGNVSSLDSDNSESVKDDNSRSSVREQLPTRVENVPAVGNGRKDELKLGGAFHSDDEFTFESPPKKMKRGSSESLSSRLSTTDGDEQNKTTLRRSQRSTRARGVSKYQAEPVTKKGRGNVRQKASRGRGKKAGNVNIEELVIEAVVKTNPSWCSQRTSDYDTAHEENAAERDVVRRSLGGKNVRGRGRGKRTLSARGRSCTTPNTIQELGKDEECSRVPVSISSTPVSSETPDNHKGTKEEALSQAVTQRTTNGKEQDGEAEKEQPPYKEPFSCWGSGMKPPTFNRLKNSPTKSAKSLRMLWSNKLKQFSAGVNVNTAPEEGKGTMVQPGVLATETHPTQQNHIASRASDMEEDLPNLMIPETDQVQEDDIPPAGNEDETNEPCTTPPAASQGQKKINTKRSGGKGSKKRPFESIQEVPECQNTTPEGAEGAKVQKRPRQRKTGVRGTSQSQGCARMVVYDWSESRVSVRQLQDMGSMGQVINVTSTNTKKRVAGKKNRSLTSESSSNGKNTSMGSPEPSAEQRTMTKTPEQMSTSTSSPQQNSTTTSTPQLPGAEKSNTEESTSKLTVKKKRNITKLSVQEKSKTAKSALTLEEEKSKDPENTSELSVDKEREIAKDAIKHSATKKRKTSGSDTKLSAQEKRNAEESKQTVSVKENINSPEKTPKILVQEESRTIKSASKPLEKEKTNAQDSTLELSVEEKIDTSESKQKLTLEENGNTPESTSQNKRNTTESELKLLVEKKRKTPEKAPKLSLEEKSKRASSAPKPVEEEKKSNASQSAPELSQEEERNIAKHAQKHSAVEKRITAKNAQKLSVQEKRNTTEEKQKHSVEEKRKTSENAPKYLVQKKSKTVKSASKPLEEEKSNAQDSTLELSVDGNICTPDSKQKLKLGEKIISSVGASHDSTWDKSSAKNVPKSSLDTSSQSEGTPQAAAGQKTNTSQSRIESLSDEENDDPKNSSPVFLSAFHSFVSKSKVDTVSSESKKELSSNSQLSSVATLKENEGSEPMQGSSDSEETPLTRRSHTTSMVITTPPSSPLSSPRPCEPPDIGESLEQSSGVVQRVSSAEVSSKLPSDEDSTKNVDGSNSHMNETEYCSASPKSAESFSDIDETSEEHCLMAYTMLPPTPEKKMGRICHTMVKEGKVMVAFPSPSKPFPSPEQTLIQSPKLKTQIRDQMDSPDSCARRCLDMNSVYHSQRSNSIEKEANLSPQVKLRRVNSQVSFSSVRVLQGENEDPLREKTDYDDLELGKETLLGNKSTVDQAGTQGEKRFRPLNITQSIREEESVHHTNTNSEKQNTSESPRKQIPTDFKHFSAIGQQSPEIDTNLTSGKLGEGNCEEKVQEEEDSDVLKIEEPSENENEESEDELCTTLNLTLSDFIDIFSFTAPKKPKQKKKPTVLATKPKKPHRENASPRKKTEKHPIQNTSPRENTGSHTPRKDKSKRPSNKSTTVPHISLDDQHNMNQAEEVNTASGGSNSTTNMAPGKDDTRSRPQEYGSYAGRSKPEERVKESHSFAKKRRRITPIRLGDVEQHLKACKEGSWGTPKKSQWGYLPEEMVEGRGGNLTQTEGLGARPGNLSERSASSLSSLSPGCLLISESPRGADSPAPFTDFTVPSSCTTTQCTTAPTLATPTKTHALTASSSTSSSDSSLSLKSRARRQQGDGDTYFIESETSQELEDGQEKQRKVHHMAQELHRGGNLEIARSPDKQLAIMMSHPAEGTNVYLSEESLHNLHCLSRTPPTPGKHLFIPPPPILASSLSTTSSSSSSSLSLSQAKQDSINLPLKKRKESVSGSGQINAQKSAKANIMNKFFDTNLGNK